MLSATAAKHGFHPRLCPADNQTASCTPCSPYVSSLQLTTTGPDNNVNSNKRVTRVSRKCENHTSSCTPICVPLGGSEQKKKGGRNADSLRTARSASVQQYKWRSNLPRIWPHLRVLVASAWRKLTDGHSQVANPVFFSLGVCENNISLFFLSLAKLCRLKFAFTEQEK